MTHLTFHQLRIGTHPNSAGRYPIVRWDTDETIMADLDTIKLYYLLTEGKSLRQAGQILHLTPGNVSDLVRLFVQVGFVASLDGRPLPDTGPRIHPSLPRLPRRYFAWSTSRPFLVLSFALILSGTFIGLTHPQYLPSYTDYFWSDNLLLVLLVGESIGLILLAAHELAHFVVARAIGTQASFHISARYLDLVAETRHYHLAVAPKPARYLVYFSGIYFDLACLAIIFWLYFLKITHPILPVIFLTQIGGIVWEFSAFLETDMYNFLSDFMDQDNLYADTQKYLWRKLSHTPFKKIFRPPATANNLKYLHAPQKRQLAVYSLVFAVGILYTTLTYLLINLPINLTFIFEGVGEFISAIQPFNFSLFVQSLAILFLLTYSDIWLVGILFQKIRHHESLI